MADRDPDAPDALTPVLLQLISGRSGSTVLMQLLATSDAIAFDRMYPFENRYLLYLLHLFGPLGEEYDPDRHISQSELLRRPEGRYGPLPFAAALDRGELQRRLFAAAWAELSAVVREGQPRARYFAEKMVGDFSLLYRVDLAPRLVHLVRDPRDIFTSIRAFDDKRGFYGFGRTEGQSEDEFLDAWMARVKQRHADLARQGNGPDVMRVRYEELVCDLPGTARALGAWLGVELAAAAVDADRESYRHHMTADDPKASIGRWRDELPRSIRKRIERGLREEMSALGY
jgi:hypothetical protein